MDDINRQDDVITGGAVPLNLAAGDCATPTASGICVDEDIKLMQDFAKHFSIIDRKQTNIVPQVLIEKIKGYLEVDSELDIWEHHKFQKFVGRNYARKIIEERFKPPGPAHSTALLDNFNIDTILHQWTLQSVKLFDKKFYHIQFQMIDFIEENTELNRLNIKKLIEHGYKCFGVVL